VELASPDQFLPAVPGWRERSIFIARHGLIAFYHDDPYGQALFTRCSRAVHALFKLQRRHDRDVRDVRSFVGSGLVRPERLREMVAAIEPDLARFPAIDPLMRELVSFTSALDRRSRTLAPRPTAP
jgi:hypothetical protein